MKLLKVLKIAAWPKYLLLIFLSFLYLLPFYIIARNALMTQREIAQLDWQFWAKIPQWQNIGILLKDPIANMQIGLRNSAIVSIAQVAGRLIVTSMAGYGLARIKYKWANQVFFFTLIALMVPSAAIFVQTFLVVSYMGWVNTLSGLVVPGIFDVFSVFIFRQFFLDFPIDLEDASKVDGLGTFGTFAKIVVPNSTGVFISLGTLGLIRSWNSFLWPLVIGQTRDTWTVQVVLSTFLTAQTINLPALFMGAAMGILPIIFVFFFVQRYIVEGVKVTGVKG